MTRYCCTHDALRCLAAADAVPPLRFGEHGVMAAETSANGRGGGRLRNLRRNLEHTVGVNVFFGRLARDARRAGHPLPQWWSEAEATQHFRHDERTYWIRPDGAGLCSLGARRVPFLFEYDRGTMRRRDYERKFVGIAAYFNSGSYEAFFGARPIVLVVAEHDRGEERFADAALSAALEFDVDLPMLFTARWRFERDPRNPAGTLGPIWRPFDSSTRGRWLDGVEVDHR